VQVQRSKRDRVSINNIPFLCCKSKKRLHEFNVWIFKPLYIEMVHWKLDEAKQEEKRKERSES